MPRLTKIKFPTSVLITEEMLERGTQFGINELTELLSRIFYKPGIFSTDINENYLRPRIVDNIIRVSPGEAVNRNGNIITLESESAVSGSLADLAGRTLFIRYAEVSSSEIQSYNPTTGTLVDVSEVKRQTANDIFFWVSDYNPSADATLSIYPDSVPLGRLELNGDYLFRLDGGYRRLALFRIPYIGTGHYTGEVIPSGSALRSNLYDFLAIVNAKMHDQNTDTHTNSPRFLISGKEALVRQPAPIVPHRVRLETGLESTRRRDVNVFVSSGAFVNIKWGDWGEGIALGNTFTKEINDIGNWVVNEWVNYFLTDSTGSSWKVVSNTVTKLTLEAGANPVTGRFWLGPNASGYKIVWEILDPRTEDVVERGEVENASLDSPVSMLRTLHGLEPNVIFRVKVSSMGFWYQDSWSVFSDWARIVTGSIIMPIPEILSLIFYGNTVELRLRSDNYDNVQGFEVYTEIVGEGESNPFVDRAGRIKETELINDRLFSLERKLMYRIDVTRDIAYVKKTMWVVVRSYGAGGKSDCVFSGVNFRIERAPRPRGIIVTTGIIESDERRDDLSILNQIPSNVRNPRSAYITAKWGEQSIKDGNRFRRIEYISGRPNNELRVIWSDPVLWSPNKFVGYSVVLPLSNGLVIEREISSSLRDGLFGKLILASDISANDLARLTSDYLICPRDITSYITILESVVDAVSHIASAQIGLYDGDITVRPNFNEVRIVADPIPGFQVTGVAGQIKRVVTPEVTFIVPYGKSYRVKVACIINGDDRTMSDFVISPNIIAGIRVEEPLEFSATVEIVRVFD